MKKRFVFLIVLTTIFLGKNISRAREEKTLIILVDELSFAGIEELDLDRASVGLINLKTRPPEGEENLYLSINTGKKLGKKDKGKKEDNLQYLGDIVKTSALGGNKEKSLIGNSKGQVNYYEAEINYDLDWLVDKTSSLLDKTDLLLLNYELKGDNSRYQLLGDYIEKTKYSKLLIFPKKVSEREKTAVNPYLVPIVYSQGQSSGIVTSESTKRRGFIALEDISYDIKDLYNRSRKTDIGKKIEVIRRKNPIGDILKEYKKTINLLIITYIFHGLIYLGQVCFGIHLLRKKPLDKKFYHIYLFLAMIILTSLLLGLFNLHEKILAYTFINLLVSYGITRFMIKRNLNIIRIISYSTYSMIILGIAIYPKLIYNSFIGFNNLIYGARFYGLNNGIMGVLLATSLLSFFYGSRSMKDNRMKLILGISLGVLNFIILSTNIGANTGGFITSIGLFALMLYLFFPDLTNMKLILILSLSLGLIYINLLWGRGKGSGPHGLELIVRMQENGIRELTSIVYYKLMELIRLIFIPFFPLTIFMQLFILKEFKAFIREKDELKKEVIIMIITSLLSLFLNDTGVIPFIYMNHYLILHILACKYEEG